MNVHSGSSFFCGHHPRRRAVAVCVRCGEGLCTQCLRTGQPGALCPGCAGEPEPENEARLSWDAAAVSGPGPGQPSGREKCVFHPERPASIRCSFCSTPLCEGCARAHGWDMLCPDCLALAPEITRAEERLPATPASTARTSAGGAAPPSRDPVGWSPWPGISFLPLPLLLMMLVTFLVNRGEGVNWGTAALLLSLLLYGGLMGFVALQVGDVPGTAAVLGLKKDRFLPAAAWGLLAGVLGFGLNYALLELSERLMGSWGWLDSWLRGLMEIDAGSVPGRWDMAVTALVVLLLAPFCEEVFFRGYLYPAMRERVGMASAVALNAMLFSLVHFSIYGLPGRFALGMLFCLLYEYSGNLAAPLTAHALNNLLALLVPLLTG